MMSNDKIIADIRKSAVTRIGRVIADYRNRLGQVLTQEKLGEELGVSRTTIAHLEEGVKLPLAEVIEQICERLKIPEELWIAAMHPFYLEGFVFHELSCELVGRRVSISDHSPTDQTVALERVQNLFQSKLSPAQSHAQVNSLLVFYGERPVTRDFFDRYLGVEAFASNEAFLERLRDFQAEAMRLYGNFRRAFTQMSRANDLEKELEPTRRTLLDRYNERSPFTGISLIASDRLPDLGYIAVQRIQQQIRERSELSKALVMLATDYATIGSSVLEKIAEPKRRRLRTLLRKFESPVQLEAGLFADLDPELLRREASRIAPKEQDLVRIEETQRIGLHNLGVYLSEPFMDVYVATSMREDADFFSVNSFVQKLFNQPEIKDLHLRHFNPTQSWIEDRVAKGLVEALMLRRASVTVYMAQKSDTFGKDSEASVALGQGKGVIVYVPRLFSDECNINSEQLFRFDSTRLDEQLKSAGIEVDDDLDTREKARILLQDQVSKLGSGDILRIIAAHWADFDLRADATQIKDESLRSGVIGFLDQVAAATSEESLKNLKLEDRVKKELIDRLAQTADRFESRARTFRDIHPLSLQVIVRSGVLNGILVTRSVEDCARLLRAVLENTIETEVEVDDRNYRLVEKITRSTLRVVSRHRLLTFAFWAQYFEEPTTTLSASDLPAAPP